MTDAPRFSVNELTTTGRSLAEAVNAYAEGGAEGIGVVEFLHDDRLDVEDAAKTIRASGLKVVSACPSPPSILPHPTFSGPQEPNERLDALCDGIRRLAPLDPVTYTVVSGPRGSLREADAHALLVEGLGRAAETAAEFGLTFSIEPIHRSIAESFSLVTSIPETIDVLNEVAADNLRMTFDVWSMWDTPNVIEEICRHASRFGIVHVCDWRENTRSWCDREIPGDGIANVPALLGALEAGGYDGWFEAEILSDNGYFEQKLPGSYWNLPPVELVRRVREGFYRCWNDRVSV